ncbi:UL16-binding protein 1, partial [Mesocricetus auratus]|uniref:UL16-binding protein 1 n=1 Tax=Mesocricetus auratus TaxID=10036 RepID=A0ABM2W1R3_MESAU
MEGKSAVPCLSLSHSESVTLNAEFCSASLTSLHGSFKDAAAVYNDFTVDKSGSAPWRHTVQGQLKKETFLSYNSINDCHVFGVLGNTLNARKICEEQVDTLKDGADLIKRDGLFNASWDIDLDGHKMLHFDSSTGKLTEVGPGSRWMKEMWEEDRAVTSFLKVTSQGDCRAWLQEIKLHWEEKLESTGNRKNGRKLSADERGVCLCVCVCVCV